MRQREAIKEQNPKKKRRLKNTILAWCLVIVIVLAIAFVGFQIFRTMGYRSLKNSAVSDGPQLGLMEESYGTGDGGIGANEPMETGTARLDETEDRETVPADSEKADTEQPDGSESEEPEALSGKWQSDWVSYGGKVYDYNDDILTFLFLGIDKLGPVEKSADLVSGGQSDAIFLVVLNPDTKKISLIGVNRDTMVEVTLVGYTDADGNTLTTTAELAVQHGFGDGLEQSCELTRNAVSKLFYNLPIHGYVSFNMGGVAALNDALGGVRLTVLEDLTIINPSFTQGAEVTLTGQDAYEYIHYRDTTVFESARNRLARQKQYLSRAVGTAMEGIKKDLTLPLTLYQTFRPYIVTDLSANEITYLASMVSGYSFDGDAIYTMEGNTVRGEKFEEFYPDQAGLKDLIIRLFYREVDPLTGEYITSGKQ